MPTERRVAHKTHCHCYSCVHVSLNPNDAYCLADFFKDGLGQLNGCAQTIVSCQEITQPDIMA